MLIYLTNTITFVTVSLQLVVWLFQNVTSSHFICRVHPIHLTKLSYAVSRLHRIWWNSHFRPKLFEMQEFRHTFCQQPKLKIYKNLGQSAVKCVYPTLFLVQKMSLILFFTNVTNWPEHGNDKANNNKANIKRAVNQGWKTKLLQLYHQTSKTVLF